MRGPHACRRALLAALLGAATCAGAALLTPVEALAETQAEQCQKEEEGGPALAAIIELTESPPSGAVVSQGSSVSLSAITPIGKNEFTGNTEEFPLSFEISPSTVNNEGVELTQPYIAHGPGTPGPASEDARQYTFTSAPAAAHAGSIYWTASFSRTLNSCAGKPTKTYATAPSKIEVVAPGSLPSSPPSPEGPPTGPGGSNGSHSSWSPATATGLRVGITATRVVHLSHPGLAYVVNCTARCTGTTSVTAWMLSRHKRAARAKRFDFGPRAVSITSGTGGNERFVERLGRATLKKLKGMVRGGHQLRLVVAAKVKDSAGNAVETRRTVLLER